MSRRAPSLTTLSLAALAVGLGAGLLAHASGDPRLIGAATAIEPIGTVWANALRMVVIPLVLSSLVLGIAGQKRAGLGRVGGLAFATFVGLLVAAAAFTLALTPAMLAGFHVTPGMIEALRAQVGGVAAPQAATAEPSLVAWLVSLVPPNPFKALAEGDLLPLLVFTIPFALAVARLGEEHRAALLGWFRALNAAMFTMLRWILWLTPAGIIALTAPMAARTGTSSVGALAFWVILVCALMLAFTLLLYPATAMIARVPLGRLARALVPAQTTAISTRSSLASLAGLVEGAERRLSLPAAVTGLVLPLAVSTFKINRPISSIAKLLFLAHLYGVPLTTPQVAAFVLTVLLLSFATPGVPSTGSTSTLPAYLAAGIPIEGVLVLNAVEAVPDIFKTLANVTADLSAAAIVTRLAGLAPSSTPARRPAAADQAAGPATVSRAP